MITSKEYRLELHEPRDENRQWPCFSGHAPRFRNGPEVDEKAPDTHVLLIQPFPFCCQQRALGTLDLTQHRGVMLVILPQRQTAMIGPRPSGFGHQ